MTRICIPVYDDCDMLDVCGPFEMFDWAGFEIDLVTVERGPVKFRSQGFIFEVTKSFADARDADALWVPGGDPQALSNMIWGHDRRYLDFLIEQSARSSWVCSVCEGAMLLAGAGLLDGYRATTHWYFKNCFAEKFPNVVPVEGNPRFAVDRNRLTGGGISSGLDEALKLIELLAGTEKATEVQVTTQYFPDPPVAGVLPSAGACPLPSPKA